MRVFTSNRRKFFILTPRYCAFVHTQASSLHPEMVINERFGDGCVSFSIGSDSRRIAIDLVESPEVANRLNIKALFPDMSDHDEWLIKEFLGEASWKFHRKIPLTWEYDGGLLEALAAHPYRPTTHPPTPEAPTPDRTTHLRRFDTHPHPTHPDHPYPPRQP